MGRADAVIAANQESLHKAIKNIETFTDALARNSEQDRQHRRQRQQPDRPPARTRWSSVHKLSDNLDKRTASITAGINKVTDSANKQINIVGADAHRAINNIDRAVTDLAKHPSRFLFGGGQ